MRLALQRSLGIARRISRFSPPAPPKPQMRRSVCSSRAMQLRCVARCEDPPNAHRARAPAHSVLLPRLLLQASGCFGPHVLSKQHRDILRRPTPRERSAEVPQTAPAKASPSFEASRRRRVSAAISRRDRSSDHRLLRLCSVRVLRFLHILGSRAGRIGMRPCPGQLSALDNQVFLANRTAAQPAFQDLPHAGGIARLGREGGP